MRELAWVGMDVHQEETEIAVIDHSKQVVYRGRCQTTVHDIVKILKRLERYHLQCCYEASGIGYGIQRGLAKKGYECSIIAPSLIPKRPGVQIKTDRRDALQLATYLRGGLLTPIYIPDEAEERARSLVRGREQLRGAIKRVKLQTLSAVRKEGWHYARETGKKKAAYWTLQHRKWLWGRVREVEDRGLRFMLEEQITRLDYLETRLGYYDEEITVLSREARYERKVKALCCFRGFDTLSSMVLITELGDVRRFEHPRPLMGFVGLGVRERSSGDVQRRGSLTKTGNSRVRRILMESAQYAKYPPRVSKALKDRRSGASPQAVAIADRCMGRLNRKYWRLAHAGKHTNKIKGAVAREMVGFVWDVLRAA